MAPIQESVASVAFRGSDSNHLSRIYWATIIGHLATCKVKNTTF
jgi:hypothetical protein